MLPFLVLAPAAGLLVKGTVAAVSAAAAGKSIYKKGERDGYIRCSREYEQKLRRQADLFLQTTNKWKQERADYNALLDEYEQTIIELEVQIAKTGSHEYKQRLSSVKGYERKLKALAR